MTKEPEYQNGTLVNELLHGRVLPQQAIKADGNHDFNCDFRSQALRSFVAVVAAARIDCSPYVRFLCVHRLQMRIV